MRWKTNYQSTDYHNRGYALLAVLWSITLISFVVIEYITIKKQNLLDVDGFVSTIKDSYSTYAGLELSKAALGAARLRSESDFYFSMNQTPYKIIIQPIIAPLDLNKPNFEKLNLILSDQGIIKETREGLINELLDWQQTSKNFFDTRELKNLNSVTSDLYEKIWALFNVNRKGLYYSKTIYTPKVEIFAWLKTALLDAPGASRFGELLLFNAGYEGIGTPSNTHRLVSIFRIDSKPEVLIERYLIEVRGWRKAKVFAIYGD